MDPVLNVSEYNWKGASYKVQGNIKNNSATSMDFVLVPLTLPSPCISERCIKRKINLNVYFHTSL